MSHGRRLGESGHLFIAGSVFDEDGWRDYSPSEVKQLFVKGGAHVGDLSWSLSLTHADNDLIGNGVLPEIDAGAQLTRRSTRGPTRPRPR